MALFKQSVAVLGLAGLLAVSAVQADVTTIKYAGTVTGKSVNLQIPLGTQNFYLGNYNVQELGVSSFLAYCVDPAQWVSSNYSAYGKSTLGLGNFSSDAATRLGNVTSLFSYAYADSLTNANKAAGFQLALWEVFTDDLNLDTGSVKKTATTDLTVASQAQTLLSNLATNSWVGAASNYHYTIYTSASLQDMISVTTAVTPVPEPDFMALLIAGLGLIGFTVRRSRQSN